MVADVTEGPGRRELHIHAAVRLLNRHGDVPAGARGQIIGEFVAITELAYVVDFGKHGVVDVESHEIEIVLTGEAGDSSDARPRFARSRI